MDSVLKQRLVGAVVLVALGVIFIPMLLEGPDDTLVPELDGGRFSRLFGRGKSDQDQEQADQAEDAKPDSRASRRQRADSAHVHD